jgi:general secretion pathway protein D
MGGVRKGAYEEGLQKLQQAIAKEPGNVEYRLDLRRQQQAAVAALLDEGDAARATGNAAAAEKSYRRVLSIEAANVRAAAGIEGLRADQRHAQAVVDAQQALQRGEMERADALVRKVLMENPSHAPAQALAARLEASRPANAVPRLRSRDNRPVTLQFRDAQTKMIFEVLSRQTGINFIFDKDVKTDGRTTIFVRDVAVEQAIDLILGQNQLARQVLSDNLVMVYPNTAAKQKDYQDQLVRTFYLNSAAPKDVENLLKTVLGAKALVVNERANAIVMRDTPEVVRMAEKLVASVDLAEPEVMLEVEVLEVSRSRLQQLGILYPGSAKFSAPEALIVNDIARLNGYSINVSQLSATVDVLKTNGNSNVLASPRIRARNKEKAKVLIGSRVPVITTAASSSGNGGVINNTQVQYLEVGLTLDVEPTIYPTNDVAIKVNLEVSSITNRVTVGQTVAYEIGTRNASTLLQLRDGETQILAGLIRDSETRDATKIPVLGDIPVLGRLFGDHTSKRDKTEVVLSITPRLVRPAIRPSTNTTEFWFGTEGRNGPPLSAAPIQGGSPAPVLTAPSAPAPARPAPAAGAAPVAPQATPPVAAAPAEVQADAAVATVAAAPDAPPPDVSAPLPAPPADAPAGTGRFNRFRGAPARPSAAAAVSQPAAGLQAQASGPATVHMGEEFTVAVQLNAPQGVPRVRAQLRFDVAGFEFLGAEPGAFLSSAEASRVATSGGGMQLDANASGDQLLSGSGELMRVRFKALQARPRATFAGQVSVPSESGAPGPSGTIMPFDMAVLP